MNFEKSDSRLKNQEFFEKIKEAVANKFDDLATDPNLNGAGFPIDLGERIRRGEKVTRGPIIRDALISIGQDFRLTPEEIDELQNIFLE